MFVKSFLEVTERGNEFKQYWLGTVILNFLAFLELWLSKGAWKKSLARPGKSRNTSEQC